MLYYYSVCNISGTTKASTYCHGIFLLVDVNCEGVHVTAAVDDGPVCTGAANQLLPRDQLELVVDGEQGLVNVAFNALSSRHRGPQI